MELLCGVGMGGRLDALCFNTEVTERTKTKKSFAEPAVQDGLVGVDAAVAEEGPVAAGFFALGGITFDDENFFFVVRGFGENTAERIGNKGISPELEAGVALFRFAFVADAIDHGDVNAIGDSVSALDGTPSVELRRAELRFFVGDASRCWWDKKSPERLAAR